MSEIVELSEYYCDLWGNEVIVNVKYSILYKDSQDVNEIGRDEVLCHGPRKKSRKLYKVDTN